MTVFNKTLKFQTKGHSEMVNLTQMVQDVVDESKITGGTATVFVNGSTASISTVEFEEGLKKDIPVALEKVAPANLEYEHNKTWDCDNGYSHVRATLLGPGITVPIVDGKLTLGTWQQIVCLDFATRSRRREVIVQVMGE